MASQGGNAGKYSLASGDVDFDADVFKIILMQSGFSFNRATHDGYSDVSASEVANGNGYTTGGNTLAGVSLTDNATTNQTEITWNNSSWTASGGSIVASGAIIFDDTVTSPADVIIGYIDFGGDITTQDGGTFTIANIQFNIA